jgi:peptidoglycan/xylan/chitin deacetylase (PgdA/CDA1 family)
MASKGAQSWWPGDAVAAVSFSFDDARPTQVDNGLPLLERLGLKATFYVSPHRLKERREGWGRAAESGHEIGNHTLSHPCSGNFDWVGDNHLEDWSMERMDEELAAASEAIRQELGVTPRTFAYPCGQTSVGRGEQTRSYVPLVARRFLAGRGYHGLYPNMPDVCDLAHLDSLPLDRLSAVEVRAKAEPAIARGAWFILAGHEISASDSTATQEATLVELAGWLTDAAAPVWVAPVADVADWLVRHPRWAQRSEG